MKSDIELKSLDNLLSYVTSNSDLTALAPSTLGLPDPLLVELISKFQELQARRKSLSYGVKSATPAVKIIDQQIADTRASLIENIKSIQQNVRSTNSMLSNQLQQYESRIREVPEIERDLLSIQRKFEVNQNIYIYLLQKKLKPVLLKLLQFQIIKCLMKLFSLKSRLNRIKGSIIICHVCRITYPFSTHFYS